MPTPPSNAVLDELLSTVSEPLALSRQTDLELTYTSSQIALACLHLVNPSLTESYLDYKHPSLSSSSSATKTTTTTTKGALMEIIREIQGEIEAQRTRPVDLGRIKDVDRRLRLCSNPEKIVGSAL